MDVYLEKLWHSFQVCFLTCNSILKWIEQLDQRFKRIKEKQIQETNHSLNQNNSKSIPIPMNVSRESMETRQGNEGMEFTENDFPIYNPSSPDFKGSPEFKGMSFAKMASHPSSSSSHSNWSKSNTKQHHRSESDDTSVLDEYHGWTLDLEDILLSEDGKSSPLNQKKKSSRNSKKVLVSNMGARKR